MLQFLGPIANIAGTWLKGRQKKAEIKQKLEVAKIEAQVALDNLLHLHYSSVLHSCCTAIFI